MDAKKINTIEMTRKIRDEHARHLAGKTHAERIAFYREQAKRMEKKLSALFFVSDIASNQKGDYSKGRNMPVKQVREKRAKYKKRKS